MLKYRVTLPASLRYVNSEGGAGLFDRLKASRLLVAQPEEAKWHSLQRPPPEPRPNLLGCPPTNRLEEMAAELTGREAAMLVPSGTMGNLVCALTHCASGEEAILGDQSHMFLNELLPEESLPTEEAVIFIGKFRRALRWKKLRDGRLERRRFRPSAFSGTSSGFTIIKVLHPIPDGQHILSK